MSFLGVKNGGFGYTKVLPKTFRVKKLIYFSKLITNYNRNNLSGKIDIYVKYYI